MLNFCLSQARGSKEISACEYSSVIKLSLCRKQQAGLEVQNHVLAVSLPAVRMWNSS